MAERPTYAWFRKRVLIDKDDLDTELVQHAHTLMLVGERLAEADARVDRLREDQKRVSAGLYAPMARRVEKGGTRATKEAIGQAMEQHPKHIAARDAYKKAQLQAGKWGALKEAYVSRGFALRQLCAMYMANYYQSESVHEPTGRTGRRNKG